jgi:serine O-acetyltransferase
MPTGFVHRSNKLSFFDLEEVSNVMSQNIKNKIMSVSKELEKNYKNQGIFEIGIGEKLPKRAVITEIVNDVRRIIFPGYFGNENTAYAPLNIFAGNSLAVIYEKLFKQIRIALNFHNKNKINSETEEMAEQAALKFIERLPSIQAMIFKDVEAELLGDPAANSKEEIIFSYPGIFAIFVYRIAHELYELKIPFIPRIMTEYAHSKTGIDINPGAVIGEYFFIDHGTGIVIGETTVIGNNVKLYQGVTLGALSTQKGQALTGVKRHPTIEDNVVIYSNTTVLGGETVIGANSIVAGNTFVTESIPANTKVSAYMPELKYKKRGGEKLK